MGRIALGLSYDGRGWQGWQTQPGGRTLQDALESALRRFLAAPAVATVCAGRTDAGVHALQQVVHLDTGAVRRDESWVRGLNALLPDTVAVQWARAVPESFHARFDARARTYFYVLRSAPVRSPILHGRVGWVHDRLDDDAMRAAAALLVGEHDFSAFRSSECQAASPVRTLQALEIVRNGDFLVFEFRANAFLHHMVRNLMGVLVMVGRGRRPPGWAAELLLERDRRRAAPTFMPDGLYLAHAAYPDADLPQRTAREALRHHLGGLDASSGTAGPQP
ncbi:tRNA pseudouridine(38-40) synthase TruA [Castellaniella defragrans]|uniref:tRNA pseudouridine synthase A n=1 Tax=Castellaniella defragrans TaxID=75697 RepID=A0A7W9WPX1_CASDE|nr:tRNA pseudouridine(38-40) synthase TruA [Castellaniella defragrans]KAB0605579.1 tRNA pseudouridine(38-40) synthase TruA [Castellaniella defragrans]MBB6084305.1 tRNA pseudouridine38-40 synthase [Castellaniella defragrans]